MIDEFAYNDELAIGINGAQRFSLGINGAHIHAHGNKGCTQLYGNAFDPDLADVCHPKLSVW